MHRLCINRIIFVICRKEFLTIEGPWEVRRILGTALVESDGSAAFRVPAKTPIAVQALDRQASRAVDAHFDKDYDKDLLPI